MANISKEDVEHTASLARLELTENEKEKFTKELGEILNYVGELNQAPTDDIQPISQIGGLLNVARQDEITNENLREKMLKNAPAQEKGLIKVKKVF
jgi:aspartyl-tRNA(Asn)/glutamyl-tRNA(Gln) amidotransferase subunit C